MLNIIHNEPMRWVFLILRKPSKGVGSLFSKAKSMKVAQQPSVKHPWKYSDKTGRGIMRR